MLDPASLLLLIPSSIKLLESGLKLAIWDGWHTFPAQDRLAWLGKLLGLGGDVISKAGEVLKHAAAPNVRPDQAVQLWAINVACFGEALAVYWGGSETMAGRANRWGKWFAPAWVRERGREVEAAIKFALDDLGRSPPSSLPCSTLLLTPTASAMYRALWAAFVRGDSPDDCGLLPHEQAGDVQEFERAFARAFREALARGGNADIRALLTDTQPQGEALRQLLVADMAAWRHKHVFAGVDTSEGIPEMPLEKTYVEPNAEVRLGEKKCTKPALALIEDILVNHRVIYVSADFGMGKSLTARTLAWRWAARYLDPHSDVPSVDRIFPIHVRCAGTTSFRDGLDGVIRRALKRNADAVGLSVRLDDSALSPPPAVQRAVIVLDGLDELAMSPDQAHDLIQELLEHATDRQRFIVFSRPEALPELEFERGSQVVPHLRLQGFDARQVDEWLWAWPKEAPTRENLDAQGLADLTKIPILLFMLALTLRPTATPDTAMPRVQIYEAFFSTLAAGKYERGGETHPQIRTAAKQARDALFALGELSGFRDKNDGHKPAVAAIQWLMDRVAWEALRREFAGDILSRRHVSNILADELKLPDSTLEQVRIGLLLGMQAQIVGGSQQFFFGHRSFLEFAVARYWERQLRRLCNADWHNHDELEEKLAGAPLLQRDSLVFPFLCEMLEAWHDNDRRRLLTWAASTVHDETIRPNRSERRQTFRNDQRILVRQAALAIGCRTAQRLGQTFDIGDGSVISTMSAWWLIARKRAPLIEAPRSRTTSPANLTGLVGHLANLSGAHLQKADLESANLRGANLSGVNLREANLKGANLCGADLRGANLKRANLRGANLSGANLSGASLSRANLERASLRGASLRGAHLKRAKIAQAVYDPETQWPSGFKVPETANMLVEPHKAARGGSRDIDDTEDERLYTMEGFARQAAVDILHPPELKLYGELPEND